jgi:hypothetical protein
MGRASRMKREKRNAYRLLWESQKERDTRKTKTQIGGKY